MVRSADGSATFGLQHNPHLLHPWLWTTDEPAARCAMGIKGNSVIILWPNGQTRQKHLKTSRVPKTNSGGAPGRGLAFATCSRWRGTSTKPSKARYTNGALGSGDGVAPRVISTAGNMVRSQETDLGGILFQTIRIPNIPKKILMCWQNQ